MMRLMRTLFRDRKAALPRPRPQSAARLQMEELELRALPSTFGNIVIGHLPVSGEIKSDLAVIRAEVQHLSGALSRASATVKADVKALGADLNAVLNDLATGKSSTQDVASFITDETKLVTDLGNKVPNQVKHDIRALEHNLMDLAEDLTRIVKTTNLQGDLKAVENAAKTLTSALASNTNSTVQSDLSTLNKDLSTLRSDLSAGKDVAKDLATVISDEATLASDLGNSVAKNIRMDLRMLEKDLNRVSSDLMQIANQVTADVKMLEADEAMLAQQLGPNVSMTVSGDIQALNGALLNLAADVSAHADISTDLSNVFKEEVALIKDLAGQITPAVRQTFSTFSADLTRLAIDLLASKV